MSKDPNQFFMDDQYWPSFLSGWDDILDPNEISMDDQYRSSLLSGSDDIFRGGGGGPAYEPLLIPREEPVHVYKCTLPKFKDPEHGDGQKEDTQD